MNFFEKFIENLFIKFPVYSRVLLWVLLIILICCDIVSLVKTGSLAVEPAIYALTFIVICINEIRDARDEIIEEIKSNSEKNIYLISTSNDKVRKFNPDTKAKTKTTRSKSDSKSETE